MSKKISRYVSVRSPNENKFEYRLKIGKNIIGRNSDCEIMINDAAASRKHAEIYLDAKNDNIRVSDLNSTNGTFINGKRINHQDAIEAHDALRIGETLISFSPESTAGGKTSSLITGELVMESIDNYSILLHKIANQIIHVPDIHESLDKIAKLIMRVIGADECSVLMIDNEEEIQKCAIPPEILKDLLKKKTATIYDTAAVSGSSKNNYMGHNLVVPVLIDEEPEAMIVARKLPEAQFPFSTSDLKVAIAASHQISLAIQRNRLDQELFHSATHDVLTGLPNRSLFIDRLEQAIELSKRVDGYSFAVLFIDIDNFKSINDALGHMIGDQLLIEISRRLEEGVRGTDTIAFLGSLARYGGDEFAILLIDLKNNVDPLMVAGRIVENTTKPFSIKGQKISISVSIGITTNQLNYFDPDEAMRDADIAMYRAKERGSNRIEVYDSNLHNELITRLNMQNSIKSALENQEFKLHYQPIISLATGKIVGFESLLRWNSPKNGVLLADEFIDLLDTSHLVIGVNEMVFHKATQQLIEWQKNKAFDDGLHISMNFSSKSFFNRSLLEHIKTTLSKTKIDAGRIWIEITEEIGLNRNKVAMEILAEIKSLGVKICLDDFGTGFSALNYLIDFPVDILKIDKSIIARIDTKEESHKITHAIVSLAQQLGIEIVAEGIEKDTQLSLVKTLGCEFAQGYIFSEPVSAEKAEELLAKKPNWL